MIVTQNIKFYLDRAYGKIYTNSTYYIKCNLNMMFNKIKTMITTLNKLYFKITTFLRNMISYTNKDTTTVKTCDSNGPHIYKKY